MATQNSWDNKVLNGQVDINTANTETTSIGNVGSAVNVDGAVKVNDSVNSNTSINTGTSTGTVSVGNGAAGAITIDTSAGISLDSATASNFTVTGASQDLNLEATGGSVNITASEAVNSAVVINATAGAGGVQIKGGSGGILIGNENDTTLVNIADSTVTGANKTASFGSGGVTSAHTYTVNVGSGDMALIAATKRINIGSGATTFGTHETNIAPGSGAKTVNIGAADGLTATNIDGVTKINDSINKATSINTGTSTGATVIGNATNGGGVDIFSKDNDIDLESAGSGDVNINNATASARTNIGSLTSSSVTLLAGVNNVNIQEASTVGSTYINTGGNSGTVHIGSRVSSADVYITSGSGVGNASGDAYIGSASTGSASGDVYIGNSTGTTAVTGTTNINTGTSSSATTIGNTTNGGAVTIKTASPNNVVIDSTNTGEVLINNTAASVKTRIGSTSSSSLYLLAASGANININEANTTSSTYVNTGSNSGVIHLADSSTASVYLGNTTGGVTVGYDAGDDDWMLPMTRGSNDSYQLTINTTTGQADWAAAASDARLKKDIDALDDKACLDRVCQLNPVEFEFINDLKDKYHVLAHDGRASGLIAQEVKEVVPTAVSEREPFEDGTPLYKVHYDELVPYLIGAVKELQKRTMKYEAIIERLLTEKEG